ncbi:MAG TPA: cytochrome c biogenesis protein CcdA [Oligoflexia bacterium]|nr:cytochrome c biogenesis protein CcdA [Oligoflexia bacterium]
MESIFEQLKLFLQSGTLLSSFGAILLAYLGGILSSFTPCIYPMIPITLGLIGGSTERSVKDGWILSTFYVLGMACVYTVLGLAASLSGQIFGSMTNTTGWYLTLGVILAVSSLWMLDVIKFDPNVWIQNVSRKFSKKTHTPRPDENDASLLGAFTLGASSGFIAAPCTTPVLTTILAHIATERSVGMGMLLMFSFALGLGTILVAIGTFAGAMKVLPKSGRWLSHIKVLSGVLILALGMYYVFKAGTLQ